MIWHAGRLQLAHRVAWLLEHGSWPTPGLVLDHTCDVKACVNVAHLRELSNHENVRRAIPRGDATTEARRLAWRRANARRRAYSPLYVAGGE